MRTLVVCLAALLAALVVAPSGAGAQNRTAEQTYEEIINDPALTPEHAIVIRLYEAVLDRQAEPAGLRFWLDAFDSGDWSTRRIADFFVSSDEFVATYGNTDDRAFVAAIYGNVLNRTADVDGSEFWVGQLGEGMSRAEMVLLISNAPEFVDRNLLPSDLPDFATMEIGTMTVTESFVVDGEVVSGTLVVAFDFSGQTPVIHQWIDISEMAVAFGEQEGPRLAAEQEECLETKEPDQHYTCGGRDVGLALVGTSLEPLETLVVGTFAQIRADEAPGTLTTVRHLEQAINNQREMMLRYWPNITEETLGWLEPVELIDEADGDRWGSVEPYTSVLGAKVDTEDTLRLLRDTEAAATPESARPTADRRGWVIEGAPGLFAAWADLDGWERSAASVVITTDVQAGALDVPTPLLTRNEMLDLLRTIY